jgi:hypothetical protein
VNDLRARYPRAFETLARVPNPRVAAPSSLLWSVVAAQGAAVFVAAALTMAFAIVLRGFAAYPSSFADGLVVALALATGLGVAFVAGGGEALVVYAGIAVVVRIMAAAAAFRFCNAIVTGAPASCSFFGYFFGLWPYVLGAGLAYVFVAWLKPREGRDNPTLEAMGALALTETVLITADSFLFPAASSLESGVLGVAIIVTAGIACGLVLLRRVPASRQWFVLAIVALAVLGPWLLTELPAFLDQVGVGGGLAVGPLQLMLFLRPFVELFAAVVVLYIAAARRVSVTTPAA